MATHFLIEDHPGGHNSGTGRLNKDCKCRIACTSAAYKTSSNYASNSPGNTSCRRCQRTLVWQEAEKKDAPLRVERRKKYEQEQKEAEEKRKAEDRDRRIAARWALLGTLPPCYRAGLQLPREHQPCIEAWAREQEWPGPGGGYVCIPETVREAVQCGDEAPGVGVSEACSLQLNHEGRHSWDRREA